MPGVTDGFDPEDLARRSAEVWVRWSHSARDGQVHAFPLEDSQRGRWPQAVCTHTAPPTAVGSATAGPRCPKCVLGVSASGTGRRHRRIAPPGVGARALARFRRHRPHHSILPRSAHPVRSTHPAHPVRSTHPVHPVHRSPTP